MGSADYLKLGDFNVRCSMCLKKLKASQAVKNWQGLWRCPEHNEPRHPQDFVRSIPDNSSTPFVQNPAADFVEVCDYQGVSSIPGYAMPGCSLPNNPYST